MDVRAVRDHEAGVTYLTQYLAKGWNHAIFLQPDILVELIVSLRGARCFNTFGTWRSLLREVQDEGPQDWKKIGRLDTIVQASVRGEAWAEGICKALNFGWACHEARSPGIRGSPAEFSAPCKGYRVSTHV